MLREFLLYRENRKLFKIVDMGEMSVGAVSRLHHILIEENMRCQKYYEFNYGKISNIYFKFEKHNYSDKSNILKAIYFKYLRLRLKFYTKEKFLLNMIEVNIRILMNLV